MALIVQKYGGTSVGTIERIHRVADRVATRTGGQSGRRRAVGDERGNGSAGQAGP